MATLEVKKSPDGKIMARRFDHKPLTPEDMEQARRLAQAQWCEHEEKANLNRENGDTGGMAARTDAAPCDDDPILSAGDWYPHFAAFVTGACNATPDFDLSWLRTNRPDLHRAVQAKEEEINRLQDARLSEVMGFLREWRGLLLKAEFERRSGGLL